MSTPADRLVPNITRAPDQRGLNGECYVHRGIGVDCWYLHSDGEWRKTTHNQQGEYTGYFPSHEAAQSAINKYCS